MSGQQGKRPITHRSSSLSSDNSSQTDSNKISDDSDKFQPNMNGSKDSKGSNIPQSSSASNLWSKMRRSHTRISSSSNHPNNSGDGQRFLRTRRSHDSLLKQTEKESRNGLKSGGSGTFSDGRSITSTTKSKASLSTFVEDDQQFDQQETEPIRDQLLHTFRRLDVVVDSSKEIEDISLYFEKDHGRISENAEWYSDGSWHASILEINEKGALIDTKRNDNNVIISDMRTMDFVLGVLQGERVIEIFPKSGTLEGRNGFPKRSTMLVKAKTHLLLMRWIAAILLWTGTRPDGIHNRTLPQPAPYLSSPASSLSSGNGESNNNAIVKSNASSTIKVGRLDILCHSTAEGDIAHSPRDFCFQDYNYVYTGTRSRTFFTPEASKLNGSWVRANASLKSNGILDLRPESGKGVIGSINLTNLTRQHIRQLDPSILRVNDCLVIENNSQEIEIDDTRRYLGTGNIVISFADNLAYDVWYFLLKCFSRPILYGPLGGDKIGRYFRHEYRATVQVVDAKISELGLMRNSTKNQGPYTFVELDSQAKIIGRTTLRGMTFEPFWREEFVLEDLSADSDKVKLRLCQKANGPGGNKYDTTPWAHIIGESVVPIAFKSEIGTSFSSNDKTAVAVAVSPKDHNTRITGGEIHVKIDVNEWVILSGNQYSKIRQLLLDLKNDLTVEIGEWVRDLGSVSQLFLDIFQFEEKTVEWIKYLTAYELRESEANLGINGGQEHQAEEEDNNNSQEGRKHDRIDFNILFRGNTLLTKALDAHMRRVGSSYLENTLGRVVRLICDEDRDCEIDPSKTSKNKEEINQQNWSQLIQYMSNVWLCIYRSTEQFPAALKEIFIAQQEMVEKRFGDLMNKSAIQYNIAVPFVFLRFLCPAFLNPQLFGLLVQVPTAKARRTLTLIAKTLQTLANRTQFGLKEPWMSPMNTFLQAHSHELNEFLANVSTTSNNNNNNNRHVEGLFNMRERAYRVSKNIIPRLQPSTYHEGLPSLPHLIDKDRSYAELVYVYLQAKARVSSSTGNVGGGGIAAQEFYNECIRIRDFTREIVQTTIKENETPIELSSNSKDESEWQALIELAKGRLLTLDEVSLQVKRERQEVTKRLGYVGDATLSSSNSNNNNNNDDEKRPLSPVISTRVPTSASSFEAEVMAELSTTSTDDDSATLSTKNGAVVNPQTTTKDSQRRTIPHSASSSGKFRIRFKSSE